MIALLLCLLTAPSFAQSDAADPVEEVAPRPTRVVAGLTLRVDDRDVASASAVATAEAAGGWFSRFSTDAVTLRVPIAQVDPVVQALRGLGDLVERSYQADDYTAQIVDLESRLAARKKVLDKYMAVLDMASPKAIVSVEREITQLVSQIEGLEGQLRLLRDRAAFAEISVSFRYRERQGPVRDGSSSFGWLNSLNVADLLDDLEHGLRASRSASTPAAPDGFAVFRRPGRFQAVSPDDVAYRVRSVKHEPRSDLAFWQEALKNRMEGAGYHVEGETELALADGSKGYVLELGAANGEQDQAYVVALFVDGGRLVLVEATGEAQRFAARRDAVMAAIGQLTL